MQLKEELIIVRHGRSQHNMGESDDLDCGLTEFGAHQARNVGKFLQHQFFDGKFDITQWTILTSPFLRCLQTTRHMVDQMNSPKVIVCKCFREYLNHTGDLVHIPKRSLGDFDKFDWQYYPDEGVDFGKEQNETFLERMHEAHKILTRRTIVVTHGLPAMCLTHVAAHNANYVPVWDNSCDNCSITWIRSGRVVWCGRNLFHEVEYKPENYRRCFILEP